MSNNLVIPKEAIIIGGGASISEGVSLGLASKLENKCVIALNYAYKYFPHTMLVFIDKEFYKTSNITRNPDIYNELKSEPLIVGTHHPEIQKALHANTIIVTQSSEHARGKSLEKGFYSGALCGIFALSLVTFLLNYEGIIYLLGYDWTKLSKDTHFYNDIKHRGIGYSNYYQTHDADNYFRAFKNESKLKIYNVSLNSNIESFEKIPYEYMFTLLNDTSYNQDELREMIRSKLKRS